MSGFTSGFLNAANKKNKKSKASKHPESKHNQGGNEGETKTNTRAREAKSAFDYFCEVRIPELQKSMTENQNIRDHCKKEWDQMSDWGKKEHVEKAHQDLARYEKENAFSISQEIKNDMLTLKQQVKAAKVKLTKLKQDEQQTKRKEQRIKREYINNGMDDKKSIGSFNSTQRMMARQKNHVEMEIANLQSEVNDMQKAMKSATAAGELYTEETINVVGSFAEDQDNKSKNKNKKNKNKNKNKNKKNKNKKQKDEEQEEQDRQEQQEQQERQEQQEQQEQQQEEELTNCVICFNVVDTRDPKPKRSTSTLSCGHSFHLSCIGRKFNTSGGDMQCPMRCSQLESSDPGGGRRNNRAEMRFSKFNNDWSLACDGPFVGIVFNILRKRMKKGSTLGNLPTYESIYESTDVLGLPRRMVRLKVCTMHVVFCVVLT